MQGGREGRRLLQRVAAPAADAGAPKAKTAKQDLLQPRKVGPVYVQILDQVAGHAAHQVNHARAALACICIPSWIEESWRLGQQSHT